MTHPARDNPAWRANAARAAAVAQPSPKPKRNGKRKALVDQLKDAAK
jgi:hypothetical protein